MSCIAIIPARGGSTRIPRKNIKEFHGKPIIAYSIEVAQQSGLFDKIIVSTDDREIAEVSAQFGASVVIRSDGLGDNDVGTQEIARDVLLGIQGIEKACVIYPCSPLLESNDLWRGYHALNHSIHYAFSIGTDPLQDAGNYYFGWSKSFIDEQPIFGAHSRMIPLPKERVCDVNTPEDWKKCEEMYLAMTKGVEDAYATD